MDLNTLWFIAVAVVFAGYFMLEGFDFGVGMFLPFLGGVGLEWRGKVDTQIWRDRCDIGIAIGSWVPALLWGIAFANTVRGVPIDGNRQIDLGIGALFSLLNPVVLIGGVFSMRAGRDGVAFAATCFAVLGVVALLFESLFPQLMPTSLTDGTSLTIHNASSTPYTLKAMTWAAAFFPPLVIAYQASTYWGFRKHVSA